jgi:acetyl esterase/lipase
VELKKNISLFVSLILLTALSVSAQTTVKLWEEADITRKQKWSELTVFLPEKQNSSGVSVIICPGGSYYWLDMDNEGFSVAKYLNQHGITAFVLKYRTAKRGNHHPAMIQDLERAMRIVKANSQQYGINPDKVGVMGFSAGGHLAGKAAIYFDVRQLDVRQLDVRQLDDRQLDDRQLDVRCETMDTSQIQNPKSQILKPYFAAMIYAVVSMEDSICHKKSRKNLLGRNYSNELKDMMSLEKNVRADMPPLFLMHCIGDKTVDYRNSVVFEKALIEKNVKHKILLFDEYGKGGHGFGIQPNGKATGWIEEFLRFCRKLEDGAKTL